MFYSYQNLILKIYIYQTFSLTLLNACEWDLNLNLNDNINTLENVWILKIKYKYENIEFNETKLNFMYLLSNLKFKNTKDIEMLILEIKSPNTNSLNTPNFMNLKTKDWILIIKQIGN